MAIDGMCATTGDPSDPTMSTMGHAIDLGSPPECNRSNEIRLRDLGNPHSHPAMDGVAANGNSIRLGGLSGIISVPLTHFDLPNRWLTTVCTAKDLVYLKH